MSGYRRVFAMLMVWAVAAFFAAAADAATVDLTTEGANGTLNGAIFQQFNPLTSTGTGVIDSFVRLQADPFEEGYNTDGRPLEFDEDNAWTKSLLLSSIPLVTIEGTDYREFLLDINQNGQTILSLDELQISLQASGNLLGYSSIFSSPIYDLDADTDNWVKLDYALNSGSGSGDMVAFIPNSLFTGINQYVYLYSRFGDNSAADDGFEEWAVGVGGSVAIPEPGTILLLAIGGCALLKRRRL